MAELVTRLSQGWHPVQVSVRPEPTLQAFKDCIDRGYVHIKFTNTRGGTELGVPIDTERSDFTGANFEAATGRLTIVGALTLDFVQVRCIAHIELPAMEGQGQLEPLAVSVAAGAAAN